MKGGVGLRLGMEMRLQTWPSKDGVQHWSEKKLQLKNASDVGKYEGYNRELASRHPVWLFLPSRVCRRPGQKHEILLHAKGRGERGGCDLLTGRLISLVDPRFFFAGTALDSKSEEA